MNTDLNFDTEFFWKHLLTPTDAFIEGLWRTIYISVTAMLLALIVGLVVALMGRSHFTVLRWFAGGYVWLIRGTPLLVQLVLVYSGLAALGVYRFQDIMVSGLVFQGVVQAAIITLTVHEGAYISEIVRSGIESVDPGQIEAAAALGMTPLAAMRQIVLPQALRTMVPPLGNIFNMLMKSTSVLSIIGVSEMFLVAQGLSATTFRTFEIFLVVALYYLALTTIWTFTQRAIEIKLNDQVGIVRSESMIKKLIGRRPIRIEAGV
ncbi:amino acid ABC transporter permease [Cryobacterium algoritolerans]|uniref:Amino acid ABC transporter permease n=1 Tax=Cryobacterium algoritolerans TaxID=1259184 RepID=A0A4R8WVJ6_9MICO|nr:amino acid ABC transporter permease [Cryobacterium algoritolerans]TFC14324.1 amino acid ABC transporter permease [Cryobacterium algoritolerans]